MAPFNVVFAALYLLAAKVLIDTQVYIDPEGQGLLLLGFAALAAGFAIPKWWVFLLPLAVIVLAIPAGYPYMDHTYTSEFLLPIWGVLAFLTPVYLVAVGIGRLARWGVGRLFPAPRSS